MIDGVASQTQAMLTSALSCAVRGWNVFAVHGIAAGQCTCGRSGCSSPGKHPRTSNGFKDATTDVITVESWWAKWPDANVAIATGAESGLVVLDVDPRSGGTTSLEELESQYGRLPETVESLTGGGGRHILFRHPGGRVKSRNNALGPGLDVKADGGYIVAPPSRHVSGRSYSWELSSTPEDTPLADAPDWLLELLAEKSKKAKPRKARRSGDGDDAEPIPEGRRNGFLTSLAGSMRRKGMGEAAILAALMEENGRRCSPPLPDVEVERIAKSVTRYEPAAARTSQAVSAGKPAVLIPGTHMDPEKGRLEIGTDVFVEDVLNALPEDVLYRRGGVVGTLVGEPGQRRFQVCSKEGIRRVIDGSMSLRVLKGREDGIPIRAYKPCSRDLAALVLDGAKSSPRIRELKLLVNYPVYSSDWKLTPAGWGDGIYYDPPSALADLTPVTDVARIQSVLEDLLADFPFRDEASRQNFIGLLLTPIIRLAIAGNVPLHLIESSLERTGKTLLASDVLGGIISGEPTPAMQLGRNDEETDKRITAALLGSQSLIHLDNLADFLRSASLASLLTASAYHGRILGRSQMIILPNNVTVAATGNNVRMSGELAKRTVPITLQPRTDRPEDRKDFRHPDLRGYVASVRRDVLACLVGMIQVWKERGQPKSEDRMGGFDAWSTALGGILLSAGFGAWRQNAREWARAANPAGEDLRTLVRAWWLQSETRPVKAAYLLDLAQKLEIFPVVFAKPFGQPQLVAFSKAVLARSVNVPVDKVVIRRDGTASSSTYRLELIQT